MASCILTKIGGGQIEGTAVPADVLSGKTFMSANSDKLQTGTIPVFASLTPTRGEVIEGSYGVYYPIKGGYYDGTGYIYASLDNFGDANTNDVLKGKTFTSTAGLKKRGTLIPVFSKIGMWTSDNGSSYTFTKSYDYAIVTASYGRDGDARRGMWMNVSGCSATDFGQSYDRIVDKSCEAGIITKILIAPASGNSVSWGPNTGGSKCAVSIVGISF